MKRQSLHKSMRFFTFILQRLLYENTQRNNVIVALNNCLPGQLILEDTDDLNDLWNKITIAVDKFVDQVNTALDHRGINGQQRSVLFSNVISRIMKQSGMHLDIPGHGKINQISSTMSPRTYSTEKQKFITQDYKERIRNRYLELTQSGMNDIEARTQLAKEWKGLENNTVLSTILRGIIVRPAKKEARPEKPDFELTYKKIQDNFRKFASGKTTWPELEEIAQTLYPYFQKLFPTNPNVRLMIWHLLETEAQAMGIKVGTTSGKFVRKLKPPASSQ